MIVTRTFPMIKEKQKENNFNTLEKKVQKIDQKIATMLYNPHEEKYYLLTPYPTLMQPLKKFSLESIRAIARNPIIDLQPMGIYSKSDIKHHIRTQQFQELLSQMDTKQRQPIDQNLRRLAETAGFSGIYTQEFSGYFKDIKDFLYFGATVSTSNEN